MKILAVFRFSCQQWYSTWRSTNNFYARQSVYTALLSRHPDQTIQRHVKTIKAILDHHENEIRNKVSPWQADR